MPDFSIQIVPLSKGKAGFQPDLPGLKPGDPLYVAPSSLVSWNNQTKETHQVAFDDSSYLIQPETRVYELFATVRRVSSTAFPSPFRDVCIWPKILKLGLCVGYSA
jgi:hypothetical protein